MILKTEKIIKEWTDYNKHMNVAYYIHVFDIAADVMLDNFKMGGESAKKDKKSTFVVEMHTHYNQEVKLDEEVETHLTYIDHDKKRIQYKLSMFHKEKKYLAATNEVLSLRSTWDHTVCFSAEKSSFVNGPIFRVASETRYNKLDIRLGSHLSNKVTVLSGGFGIRLGILDLHYGLQVGSQHLGIPQMIDLSLRFP